MTTSTTGPAETDAAPPPSGTDRFFSWTAGLGLVRGDGWIGGVAAGIAARLRIDPLIVRGILVVAALFGFPVLFLYALAWALLPDLDGRIPLQDALRGRFEPAQVGVLGLAALGLLPLGLRMPPLGGIPGWMFQPGLGGWSAMSALAFTAGLVLVGTLLFLILRAARRSARSAAPGAPTAQRTASAAAAAPVPSAVETGSGPVSAADPRGVDAAGFAASTPAFPSGHLAGDPSDGAEPTDDVISGDIAAPASAADPLAPPVRPAVADGDAAYAAWREQHAEWRAQEDAWRRRQQDADRAAREQARRERQERAAEFTAAAEERRRIRRLTAPRTPFAYVAVVLGIALIAGTLVALQQGDPLAAARGLFAVTLVLALGMIVAGVLRRRSGFLAFATVVTLITGAGAGATAVGNELHVGNSAISNIQGVPVGTSSAEPFVQPWGDLWISIEDTGGSGEMHVRRPGQPLSSPNTRVWFEDGVALEVDITTRDAGVTFWTAATKDQSLENVGTVAVTTLPDGRKHYAGILGDEDGRTRERLVLEQDGGNIVLQRGSAEAEMRGGI